MPFMAMVSFSEIKRITCKGEKNLNRWVILYQKETVKSGTRRITLYKGQIILHILHYWLQFFALETCVNHPTSF
jgi:hypothetical protein